MDALLNSLIPNVLRGNPTPLSSPANWLVDLFGGGPTKSGITVTPETSLGLPAMWSAVSLWSQTIGMLPLQIFTEIDGNKQIDKTHPTYRLLHNKPNKDMTSYIWRMTSMIHAILWGNAYSLIEFDNMVRPTSITPFHPRNVDVRVDDNGKIWYVFTLPSGETLTKDSSNVLHIMGFSTDGITGKSLITALRENIGLGLAAQEFGADFYGRGAKLDAVIEMDKPLSKEGRELLRSSWVSKHGGLDGERLGILDVGMKYNEIGIPPDDSQFIETRKFSVTDIARITRIPPPLLYDLEKSNLANITNLLASFVKFSLNPWLANWEQELNDKLFWDKEKNNTFVEFNVEALLRGDIKTRSEAYQKLIQIGVMNPNEARQLENWNKYEGGDTFFMPLNIQPIGTPPKSNGQGKKQDAELIKN